MIKLADDEQILKIVRKHWFMPFLHTVYTSIVFLIPIIAILYLVRLDINTELLAVSFNFDTLALLTLLIGLWGLILWLRFFSFWTDYHLDGWIITNLRIIDVDQKGFFRREIASFRMERLQDVTTEVKGIIPTLLNFGDIHVQTAGSEREFVLRSAPNPKAVKRIIMEMHDGRIDQGDGTSAAS